MNRAMSKAFNNNKLTRSRQRDSARNAELCGDYHAKHADSRGARFMYFGIMHACRASLKTPCRT